MLEHDAIDEVAVVGIPDKKWGEQVTHFVRSSSAEALLAGDLKAFIRDRLSPQKTPIYWIRVSDWPLTGSGKIQKFKLTETFVVGEYEMLS